MYASYSSLLPVGQNMSLLQRPLTFLCISLCVLSVSHIPARAEQTASTMNGTTGQEATPAVTVEQPLPTITAQGQTKNATTIGTAETAAPADAENIPSGKDSLSVNGTRKDTPSSNATSANGTSLNTAPKDIPVSNATRKEIPSVNGTRKDTPSANGTKKGVSHNATSPKAASPEKSPQGDGWQSIDSGTRPAYAGIHGGTAPITVLRSSNGMLIAFSGQTGNDFTHVVRGNTANASAAPQNAPKEDPKDAPRDEPKGEPQPEANAPAQANNATSEQNSGQESAEKKQSETDAPGTALNSTDTQATTDLASTPDQTAGTPTSTQNATAPASPQPVADATSAPPSTASTSSTTSGTPASPISQASQPVKETAQPTPPASETHKAQSPQSSQSPPKSPGDKGAQTDKASTPVTSPQGSKADTPATQSDTKANPAQTLIFASADMAKELTGSDTIVPFGLPLPGETVEAPAAPPPAPVAPKVPKLRLGDYQRILSHTGSL